MDNLSTVDKLASPNVSFIERFHCTYKIRQNDNLRTKPVFTLFARLIVILKSDATGTGAGIPRRGSPVHSIGTGGQTKVTATS